MSQLRLGKYFLIHTELNFNSVLEVDENDVNSGLVKVSDFKPDWLGNNDHQLWFFNSMNKLICNKKNNFCLEVTEDDKVIVNTPNSKNNVNQRWRIEEGYITNISTNKVLTIVQGNQCTINEINIGDVSQKWKIENLHALYFYLKLKSCPSLVVDIKGDDIKPRARVILYKNKGKLSDNQLWYEDENGVIRSKLNDFSFDVNEKKEVITNSHHNTNQNQRWIICDQYIKNSENPELLLYANPKQGGLFSGVPGLYMCHCKDGVGEDCLLWEAEFIEHQSVSLNHSGCGRNFQIQSRRNGRVLEVDGDSFEVGSKLVLKKSDDSSNLTRRHFYEDEITGTIRSCLRNFAIEATDKGLILSSFDPYNKMQQWRYADHKIQNRSNLKIVLKVFGVAPTANNDVDDGTIVKAAEDDGISIDRLWDFCYVPAKCFYIISVLCDKVVDVRGCDSNSGASVILYEKNRIPSKNQLWYEDEKGLVRSKLNGYVLDSSGSTITATPYDPTNPDHHWMIAGDRIQNKYDNKSVIDISGENKRNGTSLIKYKFHGGENQRWKFQYID